MLTRLLALGLALSCCACSDDLHVVPDAPVIVRADAVELIGVSGRRLHDGDVYDVPLDFDHQSVPPGTERREAFVIVNDTDDDVLIVSLEVTGDEWSLRAPLRARDLPLEVRGLRLGAGGRIDFDVAFRPRVEGERTATLELVIERDGVVDARVVELRGRCARGPP